MPLSSPHVHHFVLCNRRSMSTGILLFLTYHIRWLRPYLGRLSQQPFVTNHMTHLTVLAVTVFFLIEIPTHVWAKAYRIQYSLSKVLHELLKAGIQSVLGCLLILLALFSSVHSNRNTIQIHSRIMKKICVSVIYSSSLGFSSLGHWHKQRFFFKT